MITSDPFIWFVLGWFTGANVMWFYMKFVKLIRNREEWERAHKK